MSGFSQRVSAAWRDNRLLSVLLELTYNCNLNCFFCYNNLDARGKPLSIRQYLELLTELAEMQVLSLVLSGGEPLCHPDFFRLGRAARELGFVVRVKSNGHGLSGEFARRVIREIDPFAIEVSLHGASAKTHDRQTRTPGSFARLLANLAEVRDLGVRLIVNTVLTAWNEHEIEGMVALADKLRLPLQIDPEVTPRDDGDREPLMISSSSAGLKRLYTLQQSLREEAGGAGTAPALDPPASAPPAPSIPREGDSVSPSPGGKHCGAGSSGLAVDPCGNVYPCVQWRRPVGNLHSQTIGEIWRTSAALTEVRELATRVGARMALGTPGIPSIGFCPGNAESACGDPLAVYPEFRRRRDLLRELAANRGAREAAPVPL